MYQNCGRSSKKHLRVFFLWLRVTECLFCRFFLQEFIGLALELESVFILAS